MDYLFERGGPVVGGGFGVRAEGGDVEGDAEAFQGAVEVEHGGAENALEGGFRVGELLGAADDAVETVLLLVGGGEDGALAPEEIDVTSEADTGKVGVEREFQAEGLESFGVRAVGGEGPGVTLGGEEGTAGGVEGAKSAAESGIVLGFRDVVDVVERGG